MANQRISEKRKIRRRRPCGKVNEISLAWLNPRGGIEGFLFEANYGVVRSTGEALMISQYIEEVEVGEAFISMIKKDSFRELQLIAPNIDQQTRVGLETLLDSPKVKMLMNGLNKAWDTTPTITDLWKEVIVRDGRFDQGDSDDNLFDFTFTIMQQPRKTLRG